LGVEAFFGWLSGDGTEFWAPVTAWSQQLGSRLWSAADTALTKTMLCNYHHECNTHLQRG